MNTLYTVFGVAENASTEEIKTAFRKLAHVHHPDKGGKREEFEMIMRAREILCDVGKRIAYDRQLAETRNTHPGFSITIDFGFGGSHNQGYNGTWKGTF